MAGAGADPALSGAAPVPPSAAASVPPFSVTWEGSSAPAPSSPIRKPCPLSPGGLRRCSRDAFQRHPRRLARLPESSRRGAPHLPSILARGGGDRDMQGHRGAADSAAPGCAPPPAPAGQRAQACWQRCHTGPLAGLLWLLVCGPHCAWGWQLMLGAGLVQAPARCPKGAQGVGRKRVRPLRRDAGPASRPPRLHAVSREPRLGQSSSVPGHLAWSPATRTWGADTPKG